MADTFKNPYNYTSPIGAALADLTRTIVSGPSRAERIAAAENMLKIKRANESMATLQTQLGAFGTPDFNLPAAAAAAAGAGYTGLPDANLMLSANGKSWDDPSVDAAYRGTGGAASGTAGAFKLGQSNEMQRAADALGETTRFHDATLAQDESQFGRTLGETQRQFDQKPVASIVNGQPVFTPQSGLFGLGVAPVLSETENKALAAQNLFPNLTDLEQRRYIGVDPSMSDYANFVAPGADPVIADPAYMESMVGKPGMLVGKDGAAGNEGLTTKVLGDSQGGLIDIGILDANLGAAEQLVTTMPDTSFGLSGNIQQWAQDAVVLADNLAKGLNMKSASDAISSFQQEAAAAGVDQSIISGMYDPRFPERSSLYMLLGYAAAKALSGGGVLSDQDVKAGLALIGNPDGLFESKQSLLAKINQVRSMNQRKRTVLESAMGGTAAPAAAPVDNIPTVATPEEAAALPPGTKFRTPDGRVKVRP